MNNPYTYYQQQNNQYFQLTHLLSYMVNINIVSFICDLNYVSFFNNSYCNILFDISNVKDTNNNIININIPLETKIYVNNFNCFGFNEMYNNIITKTKYSYKVNITIYNNDINNFRVSII